MITDKQFKNRFKKAMNVLKYDAKTRRIEINSVMRLDYDAKYSKLMQLEIKAGL